MTYTSIEICHIGFRSVALYDLFDYLRKWSPHGLDYAWINDITIEIKVPDDLDFDEVLNDFHQLLLNKYSTSKTDKISIPYRIIKQLPISFESA